MTKPTSRYIDRRTFIIGAATLGGALLTGCTSARTEPAATNAPQPSTSEPQVEMPTATSTTSQNNTLLVYFSRAGENYTAAGPVEATIGNTAVVANFIQELIACDTYEIVAATPYPYNYTETTELAQQERNSNARPAIANPLPDLATYDTILVGCGVWWGEPPMIMHTFFEGVDTTGKTIIPFTTHAGSGMGSAVQTYRELCPNATVNTNGLAVSGENAVNSREDVATWVAGLNLPTPTANNAASTNITLRSDDTTIEATLNDSQTTRNFLALLPLTLSMSNYADREFYASLGTELSTNGENIADFTNGDVTYYPAGESLAIFYNKEETSDQEGLIRMGRITANLEAFASLPSPAEITIEVTV